MNDLVSTIDGRGHMLKYKNITIFMFVISFLLLYSFADAFTNQGWDPFLTNKRIQTWPHPYNAFEKFEDGDYYNRSYLLVDVAEVNGLGEYYNDGDISYFGYGPGYKINEAGKPLSFSWGYDGGYFANMLIDSVNNPLILPNPQNLNTNDAFTFLGFFENKAFNQPSPMPNIREVLYSVDIKKDGPYADWDHINEDGRIVTGIVWDDDDGKRYLVEINLHSLNRNIPINGGSFWQTEGYHSQTCNSEVCTFAQYIILGGESWEFQYTPNWIWTNYSINWNSILQSLKSVGILNAPLSINSSIVEIGTAVEVRGEVQERLLVRNHRIYAQTTTYSFSGHVTTSSGGGPGGGVLSDVTMTLTGATSGTATTDASGNYSFSGLANGNYTVTPTKTGYTFTPINRAVTINSVNVTAQDFTAQAVVPSTYSLSGTVTTGGSPLSGVTMTLTGASSGTTTTDASGNYSFTGLSNGSYTVTPSKAGYTFTPVSRAVTISGANVTGQNFTAISITTYLISGKVATAGSGGPGGSSLPLSGVTMTLTGASSGTTTTDASGNYSFTGLSNGSYTVMPSKAGYTFTPVSRAVTISGANVTGQNFIPQ